MRSKGLVRMCLLDDVDVPRPARRFLVLARSRLDAMLTVSIITSDVGLNDGLGARAGFNWKHSLSGVCSWSSSRQDAKFSRCHFFAFSLRATMARNWPTSALVRAPTQRNASVDSSNDDVLDESSGNRRYFAGTLEMSQTPLSAHLN